MTAPDTLLLDRLDALAEGVTPGPWIRNWKHRSVHWIGGDDALQSQADIDYAVALVNAAPRLTALARQNVELAAAYAELQERFLRFADEVRAKAAVERLRWAEWISEVGNLWPIVAQGDWACAECRPTSDIIEPGWRCVIHEARAALEGSAR